MNARKLVTWITFLAVFAMAARISVDADTFWHLRAGQWIAQHHAILVSDPFSYTRAGAAWRYPGWLVEVPMYWIYRVSGPGGLNLWTAAMVTLAFIFVWRSMVGDVFLRAFVVVLAAAASGVYWAARPYLVTFVLAAVTLWILEEYRRKGDQASQRRLIWLPALMLVWANSHGGFIAGFLIWAAYTAGSLEKLGLQGDWQSFKQALKPYLWIGAGMALAVCVSPAGPAMLAYPFKTVEIGALRAYIQEWQTPDFHSLSVQPFAWLLLLTLGVVGFSRKRLSLTDFLLVTGFAYLGLLAGRNIALFALVSPMVITRHAEPLLSVIGRVFHLRLDLPLHPTRLQSAMNWMILGILALAVALKAFLIFPSTANQAYFEDIFPTKAVAYLDEHHPPGRLFNSYNWGGYLLWALPQYPLFLDGRTDLYNDEVISQWLQVVRAEKGWQQVLENWDIHLVLIEPGMPVARELPAQGWRVLYQDKKVLLFGR